VLSVLAVVAVVCQIGRSAAPGISRSGTTFFTTSLWKPEAEQFGVLPEIIGTLATSFIGVGFGTLLGLAVALMLTQQFLPVAWERFFEAAIKLLAAIPSVVYGLWGIFVLIPAVRPICNEIHHRLGGVALFGTPLVGPGLLPAGLILAIMVLPTIASISRDALAAIPDRLREAAFALGATRWEVILRIVLPAASRGIIGSVVLALGRAVGETMAVAMLIGNSNRLSWSIFAPSDTLAALVANRFQEASRIEIESLMYAALILLVLNLSINMLGLLIVKPFSKKKIEEK
jgi:phosphate transport system permease protein